MARNAIIFKIANFSKKMSKATSSQWIKPDFSDFSKFTTPSSSDLSVRKNAPIKRSFPTKSVAKNDNGAKTEFVPFVIKYEPQTKTDLAVHVNKLNEIEQWLKSATASTEKTSQLLLLIGPSGCGKTAAIKILAKNLRLKLVEWSNGQNFQTFNNGTTEINQSNQTKDFSDFLLRAEKCSALNISAPNFVDAESFTGKIIVVEEFPYSFILQPNSLWKILRQIRRTMKTALVFICSDSQQTSQQREHFSWKRLFPVNIREELNMCSISFNPVSHTSILKVLRKIMDQENLQSSNVKKSKRTSADPLEQIAEASNGDLRSAINSLEFFVSDQKSGSVAFRKDSPLLLFRVLGKFLYSKRIEPTNDDVQILTTSCSLPAHLTNFSRDSELNFDPELVVEQSGMDADIFALFLHENYLDYIADVDPAVEISATFSYTDYLTARWATNEQMGVYSSSLIGRSTAFQCYGQNLEKAWRPMRKPACLTINKNAKKNLEQLAENFQTLETRLGLALSLDIVPYLTKLPHICLKSATQWQVVDDLGRLPVKQKKGFVNTPGRKPSRANNKEEDLSFLFDDEDDIISGFPPSQTESAIDDNEIDKEILSMIDEFDD